MPVGDDAIQIDKEPAAARNLFAARIKGFNRNGRRLDAANQIGKLILRGRRDCEHRDDEPRQKRNYRVDKARASCIHSVLSITRAEMFCAAGDMLDLKDSLRSRALGAL